MPDPLPYGGSITAGQMSCESAESGISCRDAESGTGFTISREAYTLFDVEPDGDAAANVGICAATLWWTIVVLRDGRQRRSWRADVAQLVAHHLAKVRVAGSNPVIRSKDAVASTPAVEWPSGEATACKAVHTGSIPVSTSTFVSGAISSAGERFPDTEEVTGSIPVSRTSITAGQRQFLRPESDGVNYM